MKMLIKSGRVVDPANNIDEKLDILIVDGKIAEVAANIDAGDAEVINAAGNIVTPGLIDIHTHMREPGLEYKEDIISGTAAAAAGGVTSLCCMPNTNPVIDNLPVVQFIMNKAKFEGSANVFPIAAISKGQKGEILSEMGELLEGGCVGFSDDGLPVNDGEMMRRAMEYASTFDAPIIVHAEDISLVAGGSMNEGAVATELGLKGIPNCAEDSMTSRDIMIAELTGGHLHVCHVSTKGSLELIRQAKARGVKVTCEVTPHHFSLTEDAVRGYNTNAKMNPPLRTQEDVDAVRTALADGTADAIATDHAPHHIDDKNVEFALAANGIVGLETLLPLTLKLVAEKVINLSRAIELMTCSPAKLLKIDRGTLAVGAVADVAIINPNKEWEVTEEGLHSKSKNSYFIGQTLKGCAVKTLRAGEVVFSRD
ncbi:dihydroorotase [Malonomonas rubra DSM 5091]|uniref:Dihydroorotase n=1 Tax=Malonomonas rubra DSM 5091 TaxID=1122189 RepID=A0A1M6NAJ0_MALRU|nr:dihydroorotase [Malonomonas rubra]SHJ92770.1 dihydroorotase [Malonomonas rubra DSM 5091]